MNLRTLNLPACLGVAAIMALPLAAQTTTTPAVCSTATPASVTSLSIERVLSVSNLLSTYTPNISPQLLAAITSGAREIRSRVIYNPSANTVTDTTFLVAPGSPLPTPLGVDVTSATFQTVVINVSQVLVSCTPVPSVLMSGTVSQGAGLYGAIVGAPAAVAFGFTTDATPKLNNVVEVVAGAVVAYSASATGALTFPAAPLTPPGTNAGAPTVVVTPAFPVSGPLQVFTNSYQVSAAGSTDPGKLALTYSWTADKAINFEPSNTVASPILVFQAGPVDYTVTLTVTNSAGVSTTVKLPIQFLGRF